MYSQRLRIVFFVLVLLMVILPCFSLLAGEGKRLTLEEIFLSDKFSGEYLMGAEWIPGENAFSYLRRDDSTMVVSIYHQGVDSDEEELVLDGSRLYYPGTEKPLTIDGYDWSEQGDKLLLWSGTKRIWRHSRERFYFIYDFQDSALVQIYPKRVRNAMLSPDGNYAGFVFQNNIYLYDIANDQLEQVTHDGSEEIINGQFDWVYEEEFSIAQGWEWSPDGNKIAFWQIDQSPEPEFSWIDYNPLYQKFITIHYPKAGDKNGLVRIGVYNLKNKETIWIYPGADEELYIPRIKWTEDDNLLSIQYLNRLQNRLELYLYDFSTGKKWKVLEEKDPCWVDVHDNLLFLKNSKRFIWTSERDGFNHIYLYTFDGKLVKQLTKGDWEVRRVLALDDKERYLYYSSNEGDNTQSHIYRINLKGRRKKRLTSEEGWHSARFSPDGSYFLDTFSSPKLPYRTVLKKSNGSRIRTVVENRMAALNEYELAYPEYFTFETSDGVDLNAWIIKPVDFNPERKYPVLIYCYGGPGSQMVMKSWGGSRFLWYNYLVQRGYIIFCLDNRGTGGRGKAFKNLAYGDISKWSVHDQIEGVKYLQSLGYVDSSRIGIWGWSGGGYLTLMCLCRGNGLYRAGVAVAPVTDFRLYDTIWTERYMGLPQDNPEGYEKANVLHYVDDFQGKLLLIHGMADDNVHVQNSMQFIEKMQGEAKQFQLMVYPGKNHGIAGYKTRYHLFTLITEFILENL